MIAAKGQEVAQTATAAVEDLKKYLFETVAKAQEAVEELRKAAMENEQVSRASTKANGFLEKARVQTTSAVNALRKNAPSSASDALAKATAAVTDFATEARKVPALLSTRAEEAVAASRKALSDASAAVQTWQQTFVSFGLSRLAEFDQQYQVSKRGLELAAQATEQTKALNAKYKIGEKSAAVMQAAKDIDAKYALTATAMNAAKTAQALGDSLTGKRVTPAVEYLYAAALESLNAGVSNLQKIKAAVEEQAKVSSEVDAKGKSE